MVDWMNAPESLGINIELGLAILIVGAALALLIRPNDLRGCRSEYPPYESSDSFDDQDRWADLGSSGNIDSSDEH